MQIFHLTDAVSYLSLILLIVSSIM